MAEGGYEIFLLGLQFLLGCSLLQQQSESDVGVSALPLTNSFSNNIHVIYFTCIFDTILTTK